MKSLLIVLLLFTITACSDKPEDTQTGETKVPAVEAGTTVDLSKLPQTVVIMLETDAAVEPGDDAFGIINSGGELIMVGVSPEVAKAAGIDTSKEFSAKVSLTIAGEHAASNEYVKVYTISKVEK